MGKTVLERESRRGRIDREDAEFVYEHAEFEMFLNTQACVVSRQAEEPGAHGISYIKAAESRHMHVNNNLAMVT